MFAPLDTLKLPQLLKYVWPALLVAPLALLPLLASAAYNSLLSMPMAVAHALLKHSSPLHSLESDIVLPVDQTVQSVLIPLPVPPAFQHLLSSIMSAHAHPAHLLTPQDPVLPVLQDVYLVTRLLV